MSNYTQFIILCEDRQQEVFARQFLIGCGVHPRRIRVNRSPAGKQAGEQYVRQQYPPEVATYRNKASRLRIGLVVLLDADTLTVAERLAQLDESLAAAGEPRRGDTERIAVFVPRRNIETWIHFLAGEKVNEEKAYPKLKRPGECRPLVRRLADKPTYSLRADVPPSLRAACAEVRRIFPTKQCKEQNQ